MAGVAGETLLRNTFERSNRRGAKYQVEVRNKTTGETRSIHFGGRGYQQFKDSTPVKHYRAWDHGDPRRRRLYFRRHSGTPFKGEALKKEKEESARENEQKNGKGWVYTAKILSHMFLW